MNTATASMSAAVTFVRFVDYHETQNTWNTENATVSGTQWQA